MNSLDVSHPIHNLLFYTYVDVIGLKFDVCAAPCNEYIKGVDAFIDFTKKDMLDNIRRNVCCPYKHCKSENRYRTYDVFMSHLIKHVFMEDYRCWNKHGEEGINEAEMRDSYPERERSIPVSKKITMM
jgi:hypothetical protein